LFLSADKNLDGVITHAEMMHFMKDMGQESVASERMAELDPDGDGYITFIEFLAAFQEWVGIEEDDESAEELQAQTVEVMSKPSPRKKIKKAKKQGGVSFQ